MTKRIGAAMFATVFAVACGGGNGMTGPSTPASGSGSGGSGTVTLLSVSPVAGATGVPVGTPMTFRFSGAVGVGMEQYMDLHLGDLSGLEMPMNCAWSADRTQVTCTPTSPLGSRTMYTIHLGGGLMSANGTAVDCTPGLGMGGQWIMGGMMTGSHGGMGWGMMGNGWRNANGSYGMMFSFTTA